MSIASFSGLASGLDTASIITSLVRLERAPIQRLASRKSDLGSVSRRLGEISKRTDALATAAKSLVGTRSLLGASASSTDESKVRVSATGDASPGSYSLEVNALARAERTYSDGVAARDVAGLVGAGTLSVTVGGVPTDVTIEASDTLDDVAQKINDSGADVTASVLNDGTSFRLLVAGRSTGAANAVEFVETGVGLGLDRPENELVAARDASFVLDGLAITRASNRFSDVVEGVTFDLRGETTPGSPVGVEVERDTDATLEKLESFVSAYNDLTRAISAESAFSGTARVGDSLAGDTMLRGLQSRVSGSVLQAFSGSRLADFGVRLQNDGTLSLNESEVREALSSDPNALVSFFGEDADASGFSKSLQELATQYTDKGGLLQTRIDSLGARSRDLDTQIERMELRIEKYEANMRKKFAAMEQVISGLQAQGAQLGSVMTNLLASRNG